jgi:predicted nucleic acid-binding protein
VIFDTNVVIDLIDNTGSADFMDAVVGLLATNTVCINEIVFAEVSARYPSADMALTQLRHLGLLLRRLSPEDCHRAGLAFAQYRRDGRDRTSILPDFLIGAHAAGQGWPIVTRDRKGFAKYFPEVELIDPYSDRSRA